MDDQGLVFAPLHISGIEFSNTTVEWERHIGPVRAYAGEETGDPAIYQVAFPNEEEHQGPLTAAPDARWKQRFLQLPPNLDPRVRELARRIGTKAKTNRDKARAVEAYLITNHAYSHNARPGTGDRVSDFLLNKRDAHCEYFASAAVILLRCLGVPSRYVIGYLAHEPDGDNALIVRGRDAHAWAESYGEEGWISVEATPGDGRPVGRADPVPTLLRLKEAFNAFMTKMRVWLETLRSLPIALWLGATVLLFAGLVFNAWRHRRRAEADDAFRYAQRDVELKTLAQRFERWLANSSQSCPPGRTWAEHARHENLSLALPFVRAYEEARFGQQRADFATLRAMMEELEQQAVQRKNS